MITRELKINFKSFLIWSGILISMLIMVFAIYPSMNTQLGEIDKLMAMFPTEVLKIFNMDLVSLSSLEGWLLSEGYLFVVLLGSCYAAVLGSSILLKEENDKTIFFLAVKPITRKKIVTSKLLACFIYITIFNILIGITSCIGLIISNDFHLITWLLFTIGPFLLQLVFFALAVLLSSFFRKTSKAIGVSFGLVLGTYFIQVISKLSESAEFLKYFSPFTYIDARNIIEYNSFYIGDILIMLIIFVSSIYLIYQRYEKREFF